MPQHTTFPEAGRAVCLSHEISCSQHIIPQYKACVQGVFLCLTQETFLSHGHLFLGIHRWDAHTHTHTCSISLFLSLSLSHTHSQGVGTRAAGDSGPAGCPMRMARILLTEGKYLEYDLVWHDIVSLDSVFSYKNRKFWCIATSLA